MIFIHQCSSNAATYNSARSKFAPNMSQQCTNISKWLQMVPGEIGDESTLKASLLAI